MRHARWRLHHAGALQLYGLVAEMVEQPRASAEQHGNEVDLDLVQEPGTEALLGEACATTQSDGGMRTPATSPAKACPVSSCR